MPRHELSFDVIDRKNKGKGLPFTQCQVAATVDSAVLISFSFHKIHVK